MGAFSVPLLLALASRSKRQPLRPKPEDLIEAEQLVGQGNYSLSIIKSFIALEVCLKFRLNEKESSVKDLIDLARKRGIISNEDRKIAQELLETRHQLIHEGNVAPSEQEARGYIQKCGVIINSLGFATD